MEKKNTAMNRHRRRGTTPTRARATSRKSNTSDSAKMDILCAFLIFFMAVWVQVIVTYHIIRSDYAECFENAVVLSDVCEQVRSSTPVRIMNAFERK